jgi:hypothetical protein
MIAEGKKMNRSIWMLGGIAVVIVLLASAIVVGARLARDQNPVVGEASGPQVIRSGAHGTESLEIVPAGELPPTPADVRGILVQRQDNTLLVGTGKFELNIRDDEVIVDYDGPEVEVVVTHDTLVYRDRTEYGTAEGEDGKIQQVVRPGSLEEMGLDSLVSAWGQQRGSRLFADVLVFKIPLD